MASLRRVELGAGRLRPGCGAGAALALASGLASSSVGTYEGLPSALIPLVVLTSRRAVIGALVNRRVTHRDGSRGHSPDHPAQRLPALSRPHGLSFLKPRASR
jgi:hypothetical protein